MELNEPEIKKIDGLPLNKEVKPLKISKKIITQLLKLKEEALLVKQVGEDSYSGGGYRKSPTLVMLGANKRGIVTKLTVLLKSEPVYEGCYHRQGISSGVMANGVVALVKEKTTPVAFVRIMSSKNIHKVVNGVYGADKTKIETWSSMVGDGQGYSNAMRQASSLKQVVIQDHEELTYMFCEAFANGTIYYTDWEVVV